MNGNVFIGRGNTLATFRNCQITPYITGAPAPIPGIIIDNAANIVFDSCEGNANPGSVWLDFQSTGDPSVDINGGESCSIINCDVEINKEAPGILRHDDYFIVMKGVSHSVLRNNLFYFSTKGVHLKNCYQALVADNLFKDIRLSETANPSPSSLTLDACRQTMLLNNSWENPDSLLPGEAYPPGTGAGQRMALPFEEVSTTSGTTVSAQGTFRPPTYASVEAEVEPDPITNPLLTGMLAYDSTMKRLEAWDGAQWVRATGAFDVVNAKEYATIQAAISALPSTGGTVFAPEGVYSSETFPIVIPRGKPVRLVGAGMERTIIRCAATETVIRIEADYGAVEEMTIEGPGIAAARHGITIGSPSAVVLHPRLRNVLVRKAARWSIQLDDVGTSSQFGLFSGLICTDNADVANGGGIYVGAGCARHRFEGCVVSSYRNYGIQCNGNTALTFVDSSIHSPLTDSQPAFRITSSLVLLLERLFFSRAAGTKRFIAMDGENRSITISQCRFERTGAGNPFAIDVGGISRGVLILNPEMTCNQAAAGTDHIAFGGSLNEPILIGGVFSALGGFQPIQVSDGTSKSLMLYTNKVRVPRLTKGEIDAIPDEIAGDLLFRTSLGPEVYNGTNWLPMTVNRYADDAALIAETHRDKGTLAWVDMPGELKVYGGTSWAPVQTTPPVFLVLAKSADQANSSTTRADISDLTVPIAANEVIHFHAYLIGSSSSNATGICHSINGPTSPSEVAATIVGWTGTNGATLATTPAAAYTDEQVNTGSPASSARRVFGIYGRVINGATAGTFALRFRSETNGSAVTIHRGSWMQYFKGSN